MKNLKSEILKCFSGRLLEIFNMIDNESFLLIEEIRIRALKPLIVKLSDGERFVMANGKFSTMPNESYVPEFMQLQDTLSLCSHYSFYAFSQELRQGFFTIEGGHRIGIAGKTVIEDGQVKAIKNINALNIRIVHAVLGCADVVMPYIIKDGSVGHTLIVSPPGCGKTTLLRDTVRQLSYGGFTVGVADERGEIAGSYMGIAQNDVGIRTDVLDCCPKAEGMMMLLRSMSPSVIAVDEIGSHEDFKAIENILFAGVKLLCTVHGNSIEDITSRPNFDKLISRNVFDTVILLSNKGGTGSVEAIFNKKLESVFTKGWGGL